MWWSWAGVYRSNGSYKFFLNTSFDIDYDIVRNRRKKEKKSHIKNIVSRGGYFALCLTVFSLFFSFFSIDHAYRSVREEINVILLFSEMDSLARLWQALKRPGLYFNYCK